MLNSWRWHTYQQTSESEATLLICDGVLAVEAAVALSHRLHGHVPLGVPAQGLHRSVAAEDTSSQTSSDSRSRDTVMSLSTVEVSRSYFCTFQNVFFLQSDKLNITDEIL